MKQYTVGTSVICNGYEGTITEICEGRLLGMVKVRLPGGVTCESLSTVMRFDDAKYLNNLDTAEVAMQAKILSDLWFIGQINEVIQKVKAKRALHHLVYMNIVRVSDVDGKMFLSNTGA